MQVKILHYLDNIAKGNKNYIYYLNDIAENINIEAIYYYHHKNNLFLRMLQNWSKQRPTNRTLYQNYQFQYISIHSIIFYLYTILRFHFQSLI
jgi:predicted glycosyltransferase involved in capsule biosynthesis